MVDANILFSGIGWRSAPYEILEHAVRGTFQLVATPYILQSAEYYIRMKQPQNISRYKRILALSQYELVPEPTVEEIGEHLYLVPRDKDDVAVALAAIQARVDYLVSGDKDLIDLNNTTLHEQLRVVTPRAFVEWLIDF